MTTLDRYIARQYLFNVVALMVLLSSFTIAVDVALNADRFLDSATKLARSADGAMPSTLRKFALTGLVVCDLWWPRLLQLFNYTIGLGLVGAMGFTFTQLVRHREMVAVLSGGISLHRMIRPVLVVALAFMGLKAINQELIVSHPRIAPLLARDPGDAFDRNFSEFAVPPTKDSAGRIWIARNFDPRTATLSGVHICERGPSGVVTSLIHAESATWRESPSGKLPGAWSLSDAKLINVGLGRPGAGGRIATPDDVARSPELLATNLDPAMLIFNRHASFSQSLSWRQIGQMLKSPQVEDEAYDKLRDKLERIRWGRISTAFSSLLSLLITLPFFLMREPKNMMIQSLKCAPVGIGSLMGSVLLAAWPVPGLPAGFAVFLPVLILAPIALAVLGAMKT